MPQYELMYILSSAVSDSDEPELSKTISEFITKQGGKIVKEEKLGRKRMAYPIKKTRNGLYVLFQFIIGPEKLSEIEHKVRVTQGVIRYMIVKLDDMLARMEKDRKERSMIKRTFKTEETTDKKEPRKKPELNIDLDKQIEKALEEDLTK